MLTMALGGKFLTETVKQGVKWYMIFSEDNDIYSKHTGAEMKIPETTIGTKWKSGYFIS